MYVKNLSQFFPKNRETNMDTDMLTAALMVGGIWWWRQNRYAQSGVTNLPHGEPQIKSHAHSGEQPTTEEPHMTDEDAMVTRLKQLLHEQGNTQSLFEDLSFAQRKLPFSCGA